jgi:hypothetical protein
MKIYHILNDAACQLFAPASRYPKRNRIIVLLSVKAGSRAGEIAKLTWDMISEPDGSIAATIELRDGTA